MTPVDLVAGATDQTHPTVTNICRLLQSLDKNGSLVDGITISDGIRNEVANRSIDFTQSTEDFGNDPDVQALFGTLNALNVFPGDRTLCSAVQARNHLKYTINKIKQITISDLEFPNSVTRDSSVDSSVAYQGKYYEGGYEYIANPVMALRFYKGTSTITTTYVHSPAPTVRDGRIYFNARIPDDISGSGTTYFKFVDYDESAQDNWVDSTVSNTL